MWLLCVEHEHIKEKVNYTNILKFIVKLYILGILDLKKKKNVNYFGNYGTECHLLKI